MLKIGLIGCGRISKNHFEAMANLHSIECAACCDIIAERAEKAATEYNIPYWTTNYESMLKQDIDVVAICTPSGLHPEHGILAAENKKHVITEKPMACRLSDGDKLIAACTANKVKLFGVFQNRLNPSVQFMRKAFEEGRFGQIYMITSNVFWARPQEYYDMAAWRGTRALDGGAFMNQASHYVDMVQWFGGPLKEIKSMMATLARDIETEDTGSVIIRFENGAIGNINVTMLTYPQNMEGSITIQGEKGTVRIAGTSMNLIEKWAFADQKPHDSEVESSKTEPPNIYGFGHSLYYQNVVNSINNNEDPICDGYEARKSLFLLEEIYKPY